MEERYQKFVDFDWSDERWQAYLSGLYPPPSYKQVLKFKKKWYRRNIDAEFDETYEPSASALGSSSSAPSSGSSRGTAAGASAVPDEGFHWANMGAKSSICLSAYGSGLGLALAAVLGLVDTAVPLGLLTGGFFSELLSKHKFSFNREWLQEVAQEEVGIMPFMAVVFFMPGFNKAFRVLGLMPFGLAALMSFAMICRHCGALPGFVVRAVTPLTEVSVRYQLMQTKADSEVMLGVAIIVGAIGGVCTPLSPLLFWNVLSMRYALSPWTQASFRKVDGVLSLVLGRIPGVSTLYSKLKDALHNFAMPSEAGGARPRCSIL